MTGSILNEYGDANNNQEQQRPAMHCNTNEPTLLIIALFYSLLEDLPHREFLAAAKGGNSKKKNLHLKI